MKYFLLHNRLRNLKNQNDFEFLYFSERTIKKDYTNKILENYQQQMQE